MTYAPDRVCAVFWLGRMHHWNRNRGCKPAQLVERPKGLGWNSLGTDFDKLRPTLRGRYSQSILLPLLWMASMTRVGYAMAL
jgi:hypothetical protein